MSAPNSGPTSPQVPPVAPGMPSPQGQLEQKLRSQLTQARVLAVVFGVVAAILAVLLALQMFVLRPAVQAPAATPSASESAVAPTAPAGATVSEQVARNNAKDAMAFGSIDAPLTIVEWIDYRCPFCAKYTNETMPTVMQEYVDAGLVRYEVHDMTLFGDDSTTAAVAGRAAAAQGRYGEFMTALFAAAPASGHPDLPTEKLVEFATTAGVSDLDAFMKFLADPANTQAVLEDTEKAKALGVTSVPFFAIGNETLAGAQPIDAFRTTIDAQLELAGAKK